MPHAPFTRPGATRASAVVRPLVLGLAVAALGACESKSPTETQTTNGGGTTTTPTGTLSPQRYFAIAMDTIQAASINQAVANTSAFRAKYVSQAASATTFKQTYPIIRSALAELDPHSSLSEPTNLPGSTDAPADRPDLRVQGKMVTPKVGYVWIPGFIGKSQEGRVDSTQQVLRGLDANGPCGWIVDLRANNGGFFFALMASVGPLYTTNGNNAVGGQKYAGNYTINWFYRQRADGTDAFVIKDASDSAQLRVASPWRPKRQGLPVAVLHSTARNASNQLTSITASAGESITLAFKGGPPTRSFGGPTYGVASGRYPFFMPDSARIDVTDSYMFARTGYTPGNDPIQPDVAIASPSPLTIGATDVVVQAAIDWLQAQPACTASATEATALAPRFNVVPLPAALAPTAPAPGTPSRLPTRRSTYALPDAGLRLN
jgi:hypothetical protein